jgi:hypothetical protein
MWRRRRRGRLKHFTRGGFDFPDLTDGWGISVSMQNSYLGNLVAEPPGLLWRGNKKNLVCQKATYSKCTPKLQEARRSLFIPSETSWSQRIAVRRPFNLLLFSQILFTPVLVDAY